MICVFLQKHFSWSSYTPQGNTEKSPLEWGYGWYSDRMRGDRQRAELLQGESKKSEAENSEVIVISNFRTKKIPSLVWRECTPRVFASRHIKKVWEIDPLLCNHCGGLMMVSFIYEHRVIKKILAYLGLLCGEEQKMRTTYISEEMIGNGCQTMVKIARSRIDKPWRFWSNVRYWFQHKNNQDISHLTGV